MVTLGLVFSTSDRDQDNSTDEANPTHRWWKGNSLLFLVGDLQRSELHVFLFRCPAKPSESQPDHAHDDENNSDNAGWLHTPTL